MGFMADPTTIPAATKTDATPVPSGEETEYLAAAEVNAMTDAMREMRLAVLAPTLPVYTTGTLPAASSSNVNQVVIVTSASNPTQVQVCVQNSAGGYEWIVLQQSS